MTQAQLSETFNICGLEAYDQDSSYFSYPPDGKLAGFKTTSKPNCANTIQSTWSAYIPNKGRAKDGYLFVWVKSDRQCSGRFWISNDEVPQEEATIQTFTLQPDVFQKIGVKIGHSPDPAKDLDFMTYVHRSNYKDFVPLNFKCESDADFHVFFDTVAILYRGQNYSEAKHVDENDFFISLRSP
ncbi:hypothetical protein EAS56_07755 [Bradyrhizobium guangzhouense]|uniref:Uncharacterized protein n=2 Tax=Bradyrhizobium guangzhouense TaxID=1325095 RepID=A0AAE6CB13_9BRAD|nr:hypothetical protein XH91_30185 [Bradyrhizobium guangzhouense]RXH15907.1 hypothetical protein EAS56_07755 [Bradyrhizobium guangzhouense]